jgi:hypothetical protein
LTRPCDKCGKVCNTIQLGDFGSAKPYHLCHNCGQVWNHYMHTSPKLKRIMKLRELKEKRNEYLNEYSILWEVVMEDWINAQERIILN